MADQASATGRGVGPVTIATSGSVAAVVVLVWLVKLIFGVDVPKEVAGALSVLVALVVGYFTPSRRTQ